MAIFSVQSVEVRRAATRRAPVHAGSSRQAGGPCRSPSSLPPRAVLLWPRAVHLSGGRFRCATSPLPSSLPAARLAVLSLVAARSAFHALSWLRPQQSEYRFPVRALGDDGAVPAGVVHDDALAVFRLGVLLRKFAHAPDSVLRLAGSGLPRAANAQDFLLCGAHDCTPQARRKRSRLNWEFVCARSLANR